MRKELSFVVYIAPHEVLDDIPSGSDNERRIDEELPMEPPRITRLEHVSNLFDQVIVHVR